MGPKTAWAHDSRLAADSVGAALQPLMAVVVVAYLVTGVAMPVLPVYVHQGLGLGTFVVGLVAGTQFAATLVSRLWAGRNADVHGSKRAVLAGLSFAGAAGAACLASEHFAVYPIAAGGLSLVFLISASVVACTAAFGALAIRSGWPLRLAAESQMRSSPTRAPA